MVPVSKSGRKRSQTLPQNDDPNQAATQKDNLCIVQWDTRFKNQFVCRWEIVCHFIVISWFQQQHKLSGLNLMPFYPLEQQKHLTWGYQKEMTNIGWQLAFCHFIALQTKEEQLESGSARKRLKQCAGFILLPPIALNKAFEINRKWLA